jgi:hypothetical protein
VGLPLDGLVMNELTNFAQKGIRDPKRIAEYLRDRFRLVDELQMRDKDQYNDIKGTTPIVDRCLVYDIVSACMFVCACLCVCVCVCVCVCFLAFVSHRNSACTTF